MRYAITAEDWAEKREQYLKEWVLADLRLNSRRPRAPRRTWCPSWPNGMSRFEDHPVARLRHWSVWKTIEPCRQQRIFLYVRMAPCVSPGPLDQTERASLPPPFRLRTPLLTWLPASGLPSWPRRIAVYSFSLHRGYRDQPQVAAVGAVLGVVPEQEQAIRLTSTTRFSTSAAGCRGSEAATMSPGRTDLVFQTRMWSPGWRGGPC